MENLIFNLIVLFVIGEYLFSTTLQWLNLRHKSKTLPETLRGFYDEEKYQKSLAYEREKSILSIISNTISTSVILLLLFSGAFGWLDEFLRQYTTHPILLPLLYFGVLYLGNEIISLPFSLYNTFVIEEKYGFNKSTLRLFITDKIKGLILAVIIGGGLLALLVSIYHTIPDYFWLLAWSVVTVFSIFFAAFYTSVIVPIFNKLEPLPEGELRQAIEDFAQKVNFPLKNIYVMDNSKRSSKSNAFFSGLGRQKSIVLFDTLIQNHSTDELVAVLAHEVGHYKKKHIYKSMVLSAIQTGIIFYLLGYVLQSPDFARALGATEPSFHINLIAFSLLFSPVSTLLGIGMNIFSRKNEFEADEFAAINYRPESLIKALKKLAVDNLSDLDPHPAYVFVYYSHPPVLQRIARLEALKKAHTEEANSEKKFETVKF